MFVRQMAYESTIEKNLDEKIVCQYFLIMKKKIKTS